VLINAGNFCKSDKNILIISFNIFEDLIFDGEILKQLNLFKHFNML